MSGVLVTGASGFLGRHVVEALAARGCEVHAVARGTTSCPSVDHAGVHWHAADLFDSHAVNALVADVCPHGLVHLAWTTTPGAYWTDVANESWVAASRTLFEAFSSNGGRRIVVAGTSAEYDWTSASPFDEQSSPVAPTSLYGRSKNILRIHLEQWAPRAGVTWAWGRLFNMYGPFEDSRRLVPQSILSLLAGQRLPFDDGLLVRDFLYVADAAKAFAMLCQNAYSGVVNIASGEAVSIRELLMIIAGHLGRVELVEFGAKAARAGEPPCIVGSSKLLRDGIGWRPRRTLGQGLLQTCEWWAGRGAVDAAAFEQCG